MRRRRLEWAGRRLAGGAQAMQRSAVAWGTFYLALWALVLLGDVLGEPAQPVARAVGLLLLSGLTFDAIGRRWRAGIAARDIVSSCLLAAGIAATWLSLGPPVLCAAIWIAGLAALRDRDDRQAGCVVLMGTVGAVLFAAPWLWNALNAFSVGWTQALYAWMGGGALGLQASGLGLSVLVASAVAIGIVRHRRGGWIALGAVAGLLLVYGGISSAGVTTPTGRLVAELVYAGTLCAVCTTLGIRRGDDGSSGRSRAGLPWLIVAFGLAALLVAAPDAAPSRRDDEPRTVLFLDHTLLGSWSVPSDAAPGQAFTGATFGQFPQYLALHGHHVMTATALDEDTVDEVDLIVVINPGTPFSDAEAQALYAFVRAGGGLLVLGDHTNIGGIMDAVNGLTAPLGLSLAFDSAVSMEPGWSRALRPLVPFEAYRALEIPVSIGASVEAAALPTVAPLLIGRRAFADPGVEENVDNALLGNLSYDRGERYGDVVLAAARRLGRGKIVLFGDTSPFQNSALALSDGFVDGLVRWLTRGTASWLATVAAGVAALLLVAAAMAVRSGGSRFAAMVGVAIAGGLLCGGAIGGPASPSDVLEGPTAVVDAAHGNLIRWEPLHNSGIEGLIVNLARAESLPIVRLRDVLDPLPSADSVLVSVAPTRAFSVAEAEVLREWVEEGGTWLVATGWPQSGAVEPLLSGLGLTVQAIPLGSVRPEVDGLAEAPQLPSAWALDLSDDWIPVGRVDWDAVAYAVIAERPVGRGRVVVVADNGAFHNENLEGKGFAYVENVALISWLLARTAEQERP